MIDAHQHFWAYAARDYAWISGDMAPLKRHFLPLDLAREMEPLGFRGSVAVQARQSLEESRWLLGLAEGNPRILGVVGWADLRSPHLGEDLKPLAQNPKFVGLRHIAQDEPDDAFLLGRDFMRGLEMLGRFKLTYDLLVYPRQLPAAVELARRFPQLPLVLDHLGKPGVKSGELGPWFENFKALAACSNVCCKLSGLVTEADWRSWSGGQFQPFLDAALEAFGPRRLMFGSDWPVCTLAGNYRQVFDLVSEFIQRRCPEGRDAVFGANARDFYGLRPL